MLVAGLTGGIASGKSTVSRMFADEGIPVICADELAHQAVMPGSSAIQEIARVFGSEVLNEGGCLDRVAMARVVFSDPKKRKLLESIIHPWVAEEKDRQLSEYVRQGSSLVIVDVPLLFEANWEEAFDVVVLVYVPRETQEERLTSRDAMNQTAMRERLDAQISIEEKKRRSDIILENQGTFDETREKVRSTLSQLFRLAERKAAGINVREELRGIKQARRASASWLQEDREIT
jgi:dephospho-CoA kinase